MGTFGHPDGRFKPGTSGNPAGRPPDALRGVSARILAKLQETTIGGKELPGGRTVAEMLAEVVIREALKAKYPFVKEVLDRTEGRPIDRHEHGGPGGGPLVTALVDVSALTDDQLNDLESIAERLAGGPDDPAGEGPG
jgi:hypothetical protein